MVKGRAHLGPRRHSLGVLDPCHCLRACVPVVSSLGHVASSSSHVVWPCRRSASVSCHRWAVSPACHRHGLVVSLLWLVLLVGIVVLSFSRHCAVLSSLPSHVIMPRVILYLSKVGWEEWGMRGAHRGVLATTTNDVVVCRLVATSLTATWHLGLMSEK